ncbi:MAG: hypothetical protein EOP19_15365 [Hyphomicrobiales bacterium]|nr:MAG: hypothetical protein EOP19_15365 [Hyphomicrobiales bacterium]
MGRFSQGDNHERALEQALAGGGLRALEELRSSGAVRGIGIGVNEWPILDELMNHARFDMFLLANRYTLLDQAVLDHFLPRVQREGVAIVIGAALNFPLSHPAVTALLAGPSLVGELTENLGHLRAEIPSALWTDLRDAGLIHPAAPLPVTPSLPAA